MKVHLSIIAANENAAGVCEYIYELVDTQENLLNAAHSVGIYWKDSAKSKLSFEIEVSRAMRESEWIQMFDRHLEHHAVFRDDSFFEIDHYSSPDNPNDLFAILHIPVDMVEYE